MSTTMDQIHHIREMFYQQDKSISQIASETGLNRKTISKYVDMEDFNSPPPTSVSEEGHESKLDPFKPLINEWLQADKLAPRKQRHTAKRVFRRLKDETEDFNCSYRLVALYVKEKKAELRLKKSDGYLPLEHHPGEAQADFGYADFYENGTLHHEAKYLVLSFPYSNGGFLQLNYGENMECLLEGLVAMFEHIDGVPTEIWFDNTRTIVTEVIKGGGRKVTERFQRFCEHYRIKPVFMNPAGRKEMWKTKSDTCVVMSLYRYRGSIPCRKKTDIFLDAAKLICSGNIMMTMMTVLSVNCSRKINPACYRFHQFLLILHCI